jgi:hypothetical protein
MKSSISKRHNRKHHHRVDEVEGRVSGIEDQVKGLLYSDSSKWKHKQFMTITSKTSGTRVRNSCGIKGANIQTTWTKMLLNYSRIFSRWERNGHSSTWGI